ncbi:MAG: heterodisulfide reductase-related iron-sulfur binding cluster [Desulfobacterota bacterium]|nr:heterodisulfide reductase-related iron-sulfur binding cluster [Thermodesulfobacteriota bacterium]MDW8002330.1 heterodisulfide reductase-related iron-sulfur binding cluster [Deltaproteobacteria bacterium]
MTYAYYPGCALKGSAKRLDLTLRKLFSRLGLTMKEIPDWTCCGALEYGDRKQIILNSKKNLNKASFISRMVIAACPLCVKNLKESEKDGEFSIFHPLDLLNVKLILSAEIKNDLTNHIFTPYYGCLLMRPKETALKDKEVMEKIIKALGGEVCGTEIKDKCCGGNRFFIDKDLAFNLSKIILERSKGTFVVFCPFCHLILKTFSGDRKVIYFTELLLYVLGDIKKL